MGPIESCELFFGGEEGASKRLVLVEGPPVSENTRKTAWEIDHLVWQCDEHEGMSRPDVQVVWIDQKRGGAIDHGTGGHSELDVLVSDVLLLVVHPAIQQ